MTEDTPARTVAETGTPKEQLPETKLPDDVRETIARGESAFAAQRKRRRGERRAGGAEVKFLTSVVDAEVQHRRDARLKQMEVKSKGKRGQPPMVDRLRAVAIAV
jgi:hypothetical protein